MKHSAKQLLRDFMQEYRYYTFVRLETLAEACGHVSAPGLLIQAKTAPWDSVHVYSTAHYKINVISGYAPNRNVVVIKP